MSEVNITISLELESDSAAKELVTKLKNASEIYDHELTKSISSLHKIKKHEKYNQLYIENIDSKNREIEIIAYCGRTKPVTWFAGALSKLGASKIVINEQWDEGGSVYYFIDGKKVTKKKFLNAGNVTSTKNVENGDLFVSEDRKFVSATLISHRKVGRSGKQLLMEFITNDNCRFYYQGLGELTGLVSDDFGETTEFRASFVKGKLEGKEVSFAKNPTQIWFSRGINTKAKCPFCSSSLRSEKAKQCPTCLKSWSEPT